MKVYIAILRGINVSGKNKIKMEDLRQKLQDADLINVQTYIQSGNIVFSSAEQDASRIARKIETRIIEKYSTQVPVLVLSRQDLTAIIAGNPFADDANKENSRLHVTFLSEKPRQQYLNALSTGAYHPDEFVVVGRAIYLYCPNGYGRTKLTNNLFERKLKLTATTRNWKTTNKLAEMAGSLAPE